MSQFSSLNKKVIIFAKNVLIFAKNGLISSNEKVSYMLFMMGSEYAWLMTGFKILIGFRIRFMLTWLGSEYASVNKDLLVERVLALSYHTKLRSLKKNNNIF